MLTISTLAVFIPASILLIIAPGPDILFTITQGISNGRKSGVITALGLSAGNSVHTLAAAFGVSVIFKTSIFAFNILKIAGVLYLFYLAVMAIRNRNNLFTLDDGNGTNHRGLFLKGFLMNILNPKVAIFFLAFLPQFVNAGSGSVPIQMIMLGIIFMILVAIIFGCIGFYSGYLGSWIQNNPKFSKYISFGTAGIFLGLGLKLALMQR